MVEIRPLSCSLAVLTCLGAFSGLQSSASAASPLQEIAARRPAPLRHWERMMSIGDSVTQGVQSNDAAWQTQISSYPTWISGLGRYRFSIPYIETNANGATQVIEGRSRLRPRRRADNLAVAGATLDDLLHARADADTVEDIDSELDLVLFPRQRSQMEIVEQSPPDLLTVWIGGNDVLNAVVAFGQLDASQLTPVEEFESQYIELADRLAAVADGHGTDIVLANLPDVLAMPYLVDAGDLQRMIGVPGLLDPGHYTTLPGLIHIMQTGDVSILHPSAGGAFVLDPDEIAAIVDRTNAFNTIIEREADRIGVPVVDVYGTFQELASDPPEYFGHQLSVDYLGGLFSFDGIHPSNTAHALLARTFITTINDELGLGLPNIPDWWMNWVYLADPHIDKDRDGKVTGRFGVGQLESLAVQMGLSGDPNDHDATQ